jgi:hypothetical protein
VIGDSIRGRFDPTSEHRRTRANFVACDRGLAEGVTVELRPAAPPGLADTSETPSGHARNDL